MTTPPSSTTPVAKPLDSSSLPAIEASRKNQSETKPEAAVEETEKPTEAPAEKAVIRTAKKSTTKKKTAKTKSTAKKKSPKKKTIKRKISPPKTVYARKIWDLKEKLAKGSKLQVEEAIKIFRGDDPIDSRMAGLVLMNLACLRKIKYRHIPADLAEWGLQEQNSIFGSSIKSAGKSYSVDQHLESLQAILVAEEQKS